MAMTWHPSWWTDVHLSAWERIKEAIRRDWEQTRYDLNLGGHQLNQGVMDTIDQAAGNEEIPPDDRPNPPKVIGSFSESEMPIGYGYGARWKYGSGNPMWNDHVEGALRSEWETGNTTPWRDVKRLVRFGYEYETSASARRGAK